MQNSEVSIVEANKPSLPLSEAVYGRSGKIIRHVTRFSTQSAAEIRKALKASGLKGKDLTMMVNESLNGTKDVRNVLAAAMLQSLVSKGYVADKSAMSKNAASISFVMVKDTPAVAKAKSLADMSDDELTAELARRASSKN